MTGPYYSHDGIEIWHADVRDMIDVGPVACVVTSPPYNVGIEYDTHDDRMPWADYQKLAASCAQLLASNLIDGGRCWLNVVPAVPVAPIAAGWHSGRGGNPRVNLLRLWSNVLEDAGLAPWDCVAWTTPGRERSGTAWGSWQSPAGPNLRGDWEAILLHYRTSWTRPTPEAFTGWKDNEGGWIHLTTNRWKMTPETRNGHPTPYPLALPLRAIRLSTWPGEVVFDPFAGTGTTLAAAKQLGRKAVGVEVSERYCELAARRLDQGVLF